MVSPSSLASPLSDAPSSLWGASSASTPATSVVPSGQVASSVGVWNQGKGATARLIPRKGLDNNNQHSRTLSLDSSVKRPASPSVLALAARFESPALVAASPSRSLPLNANRDKPLPPLAAPSLPPGDPVRSPLREGIRRLVGKLRKPRRGSAGGGWESGTDDEDNVGNDYMDRPFPVVRTAFDRGLGGRSGPPQVSFPEAAAPRTALSIIVSPVTDTCGRLLMEVFFSLTLLLLPQDALTSHTTLHPPFPRRLSASTPRTAAGDRSRSRSILVCSRSCPPRVHLDPFSFMPATPSALCRLGRQFSDGCSQNLPWTKRRRRTTTFWSSFLPRTGSCWRCWA